MLQSLHYAHLALRISLAIAFVWLGIDKFLHPQHWLDAWVPRTILTWLSHIGVSGNDFVYFLGILEVLIGTSIISTLFLRFFATVGIVLLSVMMVFHGLNEVTMRDVIAIGSLCALIMWPSRRF